MWCCCFERNNCFSLTYTRPVFFFQTIPICTAQIPQMCFYIRVPFLSSSSSRLSASPFPPPGFSISVVEEDGVQQLYITDVKAGGLAFAKGSLHFISIKWTPFTGIQSVSVNWSDTAREKKNLGCIGCFPVLLHNVFKMEHFSHIQVNRHFLLFLFRNALAHVFQ